jgi:hypothetical protein
MAALMAGVLTIPAGCALVDGSRTASRETLRAAKPRPSDYRDPTDEPVDEYAYVGQIARNHRPVEKDPDPWFRQIFMSEKARSIERNLGFE